MKRRRLRPLARPWRPCSCELCCPVDAPPLELQRTVRAEHGQVDAAGEPERRELDAGEPTTGP